MPRFSLYFLCAATLFLLAVFPVIAAESALPVPEIAKDLAENYQKRVPTQWGEHLPGILTTLPSTQETDGASHTVALTLDACDGGTDTRIISLLRKHNVPATIFLTNRWLRQNKAIAEDLGNDPLFALACHGKRHKPASTDGRKAYGITGTKTIPALVEEVEDNARAITDLTGKRPCWYRSGTAHYDDVALSVIADLGFAVAGYSVSADQGASLPAHKVARNLLHAPDKAIILLHLNHPESGTYQGLAAAIPTMLTRGVYFVKLE